MNEILQATSIFGNFLQGYFLGSGEKIIAWYKKAFESLPKITYFSFPQLANFFLWANFWLVNKSDLLGRADAKSEAGAVTHVLHEATAFLVKCVSFMTFPLKSENENFREESWSCRHISLAPLLSAWALPLACGLCCNQNLSWIVLARLSS